MRPEYEGIKFYSKNDMSIGWELEKALKDATEITLTKYDKDY